MKYLLLVLFAFCFVACAPETPVGKAFWEANKLEIIVERGGGTGMQYQTNDVEKIKAFHDYIDHADSTVADGCTYEGTLTLYYTETKTENFKFSLQPGCAQITGTINGETYTRPFTADGVAYLESLQQASVR